MRSLWGAALVALSTTLSAYAQGDASQWCDEGKTGICFQRYLNPNSNIGWGYLFPASNPGGGVPNEFIGIYTAPTSVGWIGNSVGGVMNNSPLILGWVNGHKAMVSLRRTENWAPPRVWTGGPVVTLLGGSGVTRDGEQRIIYRCQNCTTWQGGPGSINLDSTAPVGYAAHTTNKPSNPSAADSPINMHTIFGIQRLDVPAAKSAQYWDHLKALQDAPELPDPSQPEPTPTSTATPEPTPTSTPGGYEAVRWCDEGQTGVCFHRYHDADLDIGWGYLFPQSNPDGSVPDELIGIYTAPVGAGWIGNSLGGGMTSNPLVLGWVDGITPRISLRRTDEYGPPRMYPEGGPVVTILGGSGVTRDGQQRIIWRCQKCTVWEGGPGGINLNSTVPVGFAAHASAKPLEPSVSDSPVYMHTVHGIHRLDVPAAKSADYWDIVRRLEDAPNLPDPSQPEPTPTSTATPTPTPTSTPGGYEAVRWCDEGQTGVCFHRYHDAALDIGWGYLFPESNRDGSVPNELIGIYTAPASAGWIGNSLGGGMTSNPLVLGWVDGTTPMISLRRTDEYGPPRMYPEGGPVVTILGGSGITSGGQQRIIWRCQNCTVWEGGPGGINLSSTGPFGFAAHANVKPLEPSASDSPVYMHTVHGIHRMDVPAAKSAEYWDILERLENTPQLPGPGSEPTPTPTTTATPTPTDTTTPGPGPTGNPLPACRNAAASRYPLVVANGWRATPALTGLQRPRSIVLDSQGQLLVLESGKGVSVHKLDEAGCVISSSLLIPQSSLNHGLDLSPNGRRLVASSSDAAWSWEYDPVALTAINRRQLVYGMHNPGHVTRTVWISKKYPDYLMVSVGSNGNVDIPAFQRTSGTAQIRAFDMRSLPPNGIPYTSGAIMGYGIRNDVGITEDREGTIFSVENSVDMAYREIDGVRKDIHNDNPAEKVYRLGDPRSPSGLFGGYPYCFTVWEGSDFDDSIKNAGDWFTQAPNATINDQWCDANAVKPIALLPPHTAPLDMKFAPRVNDGNLYVGLHGSWNRSPPQGYKVVVIPGRYSSAGAWSPAANLTASKTGFTDILANVDENNCQAGCFRPVGLAFHKDGDWLYVSGDSSGEVIIMKREPDPTSPPIPTTTITTTTTAVPTSTTPGVPGPTTTTTPGAPQQTPFGQCGGRGYTGITTCPPGQTCRYVNLYFSQCVNA